MKRAGTKAQAAKDKGVAVALALTWDGERWPVRGLPVKAQAFLKASSAKSLPSSRQLAKLFAGNEVKEIRICWVPRLKGGEEVLAQPFAAPKGKRIGFAARKTAQFGDVLGVVYRKNAMETWLSSRELPEAPTGRPKLARGAAPGNGFKFAIRPVRAT